MITKNTAEDLCGWPCENTTPCPEHDGTGDPTRFVWMRDGLLNAGTLDDWARMWEGDYYASEDGLTRCLLSWDGEPHTAVYHGVTITRGIRTENDYVSYTFTVPGLPDKAVVWIDGRN